MFSALLAASGNTSRRLPPDRYYRYKWVLQPLEDVTAIIEAQRDACRENGDAFWDMGARMGGKASMRHGCWAQRDYQLLGKTLFKDVMGNYEHSVKARESTVESAAGAAAEMRPYSVLDR